jgi:hypothetical protein
MDLVIHHTLIADSVAVFPIRIAVFPIECGGGAQPHQRLHCPLFDHLKSGAARLLLRAINRLLLRAGGSGLLLRAATTASTASSSSSAIVELLMRGEVTQSFSHIQHDAAVIGPRAHRD